MKAVPWGVALALDFYQKREYTKYVEVAKRVTQVPRFLFQQGRFNK